MNKNIYLILLLLLSIGIVIMSIIFMRKVNDCKTNSSQISVGMDISVDPSNIEYKGDFSSRINQCNRVLSKLYDNIDFSHYDLVRTQRGWFPNQPSVQSYYCYNENGEDMLVDPTSNDVCYGGAAIVPSNFGNPPYLGSCSRPLNSNPNMGFGNVNYLCTTDNRYPIAQNICGGGGINNKGDPCKMHDNLYLPPGVGVCF